MPRVLVNTNSFTGPIESVKGSSKNLRTHQVADFCTFEIREKVQSGRAITSDRVLHDEQTNQDEHKMN